MTRLIDAESLKKAIYKWIPKAPEDLLKSEIPLIENLVVSMMMTIEEQPTIDAISISFIEEQAKMCDEVGFRRGEECYMSLIEKWRKKND